MGLETTDTQLLQGLGKDNRMYIAAKTAIRELRKILPMDEGIEREKQLEQLLNNLIRLDEM